MALTKLFKAFYNSEKAGGLLLLVCTIASLIVANSNWGESYLHFWHQKLDLSFAAVDLNYSIEQWINDGLMTIFFFALANTGIVLSEGWVSQIASANGLGIIAGLVLGKPIGICSFVSY